MILNLRASIKTVERERAENIVFLTPIDLLDGQCCHLLELVACPFALIFLLETLKVQRIMFLAERMNIVNDNEVLSMLVSLFTMIPEGAGIGNQLAALLEKDIVESDDSTFMKLGVLELLEPIDTGFVDGFVIPIHFGKKSIETGLIGGVGHFIGHTRNGLVFRNHQTGKVMGKMFLLGDVGE